MFWILFALIGLNSDRYPRVAEHRRHVVMTAIALLFLVAAVAIFIQAALSN